MYFSNHLQFNKGILSKWIKDSKNTTRAAKEMFSKNMDRKIVAQEMTHCVIFPDQETELVQHIKLRRNRGFHVSGRWARVKMIQLMHKSLQEQGGTWLIIKTGAFKASRCWMIKLIRLQHISYKIWTTKIKSEYMSCGKSARNSTLGCGTRLKNLTSGTTHQILITSG